MMHGSYKNFLLAVILASVALPFSGAQAATVNSVSQTQGLNFGTFDPNNNGSGTGGTVKTNSCAVTGSVKSLTTCSNASFLVQGTNASSGSNRARIKTVLKNPSATIKNGSNSMTITFSFSSTASVVTQQVNMSPTTSGASASLTVPVYSTITVSGTQANGNYTQNSSGGSTLYDFVACNCPNGICPSDSSCN